MKLKKNEGVVWRGGHNCGLCLARLMTFWWQRRLLNFVSLLRKRLLNQSTHQCLAG